MTPPIGVIANPASGKDIRRLVAHASVFDNAEKSSIIRRALAGAVAMGATRFLYMPDDHALVERALDGLSRAQPSTAHSLRSTHHSPLTTLPFPAQNTEPPSQGLDSSPICCTPVVIPGVAAALDTIRAAERMREAGCAVLLTLGGDGTNRAVALGWRDAPLIAVSTGTNNVFPAMMEGTVAGAAAGLIATGTIPCDRVARPAKRVRVQLDGDVEDLALIDAVLLSGAFTGARAIWDAPSLRVAVLTRAEPAAVGIAAVGGLLHPLGPDEDGGLLVEFGDGPAVRAPLAPGLYRDIPIRAVRRLREGEPITVEGPGILALDGERERPLAAGCRATLTILRDGPRVVDVARTLREGAPRATY